MNEQRASDRVTICLTSEMRKRLKIIAAIADVSISEYIRMLIEVAIEQESDNGTEKH
jgi:hypothetical protein